MDKGFCAFQHIQQRFLEHPYIGIGGGDQGVFDPLAVCADAVVDDKFKVRYMVCTAVMVAAAGNIPVGGNAVPVDISLI